MSPYNTTIQTGIFALVWFGLAVGCGESSSKGEWMPAEPSPEVNTNDPDDTPSPLEEPPAPSCPGFDGEAWRHGETIFREATGDWGLEELGVQGVRFNVLDVNADGWPDLLVRRGGNQADDFAPEGTRRTWLLRNSGQGSFEDITESSGFRQWRGISPEGQLGRPGEVVAAADVDNDGDIDIYTGLNTTDPDLVGDATSELLLNDGDGGFVLGPVESELRRLDDVPAGASFIDFNRDGAIDLWVTQSIASGAREASQDRLYQGDGQGGFVDVTRNMGLRTFEWSTTNLNEIVAHSNAWGAAACDLNNDGWPELLASSYGRAPNHLWRADERGDQVRYTNASARSGYSFDERQDWRDNQSAQCYCQLHPDASDCEEVEPPMLIRCESDSDAFRWSHDRDRDSFRLGGNSGTTVCADVNNDGHIDLLTTEIVHWDVGSSSDPSELLLNRGDSLLSFERPGNEATGLTRVRELPDWNDGDITAAIFDFDNDGWPDIYIGSTDYPGARGLLFHQEAPGEFVPVPVEEGIDHTRSHGVVAVDLDRDGDLDLVVGHSRARCGSSNDCYNTTQVRIFENMLGARNPWIQLVLEGAEGTNRSAIGARVSVETDGATQTQEVDGGHGHYGGQKDTTLHFGLGHACSAVVSVRWPNEMLSTESFTLEAGQRYLVRQGEMPLPLP